MSLWTILVSWSDIETHVPSQNGLDRIDVLSDNIDEAQAMAVSILCSMHTADTGIFPTERKYSVVSAKEKIMEEDYSPYTRRPTPGSPTANGYSPYTSNSECPNCGGTFHTDSYDPYAGDYEPGTEGEWTDEWTGDDESAWEDLPTEHFSYADYRSIAAEPAHSTIRSLSGMVISKLTALANGYVPYIKAHFFV